MPVLAPSPKFRAVDDDGSPLVGGKLYSYTAGTSTPKLTYVSFAGAANTNPVILDARGEADVWLDGNYKLTLLDANDVQIWSVDDIRDLTSSATFTNATLAGTLTVTSMAVTWSGNPTHSGNHTFTNNVVVNGNTTLGDSSADTLTIRPNAVTWTNNPTHSGNHIFSGNLTVSGTLTAPPPTGSFTPGVTFGGGSTGVTYNINRGGVYFTIGPVTFFYGRLRLSNKGSSTGTARITGFPATAAGSGGLIIFPATLKAYSMTGLTGDLTGAISGATPLMALSQSAADGSTVDVTDAEFTNSSDIYFSGFYPA